MKVSMKWLSDYVTLPPDLTPAQLAYDLTMTTVEVEKVEDLGETFNEMFVGLVTGTAPHPDADRLSVVTCQLDEGRTLSVVCGGNNVTEGMKVAIALPGAVVLWHGEGEPVVLEETAVRGVASDGMICGADEIGLSQLFPPASEGEIVDLSELEAEPGTPLAEALGLDDLILEIDNKSLTNRPDLWGHYGLAREFAALYELPLAPLPAFAAPDTSEGLAVAIEDAERCRRYTATQLAGVKVEASPYWLRSRLASVGQRPINLLVDLTNYVMLAVGQPSHAFDAGRLTGTIAIRQARPEEEMELLDGQSVSMDPDTLVIADDDGAVALAGVMGGLRSSVADDTSDLVLEVAHFEPVGVRRAAGRYGCRTESSTRFEKGLDPCLVDTALGLFLSLLKDIQPEARATAHLDSYPAPYEPVCVDVTTEFINRRVGKEQTAEELSALLVRLGFEVEAVGASLHVDVPTWRATGDVSLPEDIVEEVSRLYGYDRLAFVPPTVTLEACVSQPEMRLRRRVREYLATSGGMQEILSYPWVHDRYLEAAGISLDSLLSLAAPPAPDQCRLQPSLVPQLLRATADNLRYQQQFRLFELSRVFKDEGFSSLNDEKELLPSQPKHLGAALVGEDAGELLLAAKGLLEAMGRDVQMSPLQLVALEEGGEAPWAEPKGCLAIEASGEGIGHLGVVSSKTMRLAGIRNTSMVIFELEADRLQANPSRDNTFSSLPEFPLVDFDLSVLFPIEASWADIHGVATGVDDLVSSVSLVEEYRGTQVPDGKKSLTVRLVLGAEDRTLKSAEIDRAADAVASALTDKLGATIRRAD